MTIKVYIATKLRNKERAWEVLKALQDSFDEVELTYDWMTTAGQIKPFSKNREAAKEKSWDELDAVTDATVFILITHDVIGPGMHVELGAALAAFMETGVPRVYILMEKEEHEDNCLFYHHTFITRVPDIKTLIEKMKAHKVWKD